MALDWVKIPGIVDESKETRTGSPFIRREHLDRKAQRSLYIQTGKKFDSESSLRRYLKDNNLRREEGGEPNSKHRKEQREWLKDTKKGERGPTPGVRENGYVRWGFKD